MKNFEHINAENFEAAANGLTSYKNARPIAGGTDLVGVLKQKLLVDHPEAIVNLKTIPGAAYIRDEGDSIAVGALTTLSDVEKADVFQGELKAVAEAAHSVATPIIRNAATLGGNLVRMCAAGITAIQIR